MAEVSRPSPNNILAGRSERTHPSKRGGPSSHRAEKEKKAGAEVTEHHTGGNGSRGLPEAAAPTAAEPSRTPAPAAGADGSFRLRPPAAPTSGARPTLAGGGGSGPDAPPPGAEPLLSICARDSASSRAATLILGAPGFSGPIQIARFCFFSLSPGPRRSRPAVGAAEEGDSRSSDSGFIPSTRQAGPSVG